MTHFHPKYVNNQKMHFNIYNVFYLTCSHQHVSIDMAAILKVILLQENKRTNLFNVVTITP